MNAIFFFFLFYYILAALRGMQALSYLRSLIGIKS